MDERNSEQFKDITAKTLQVKSLFQNKINKNFQKINCLLTYYFRNLGSSN